ncbi:ABC transporter permease [Micromonospora zamorensis]|uniref:ABC transporter permease n=1 Tax=Micromonospora zamorensis TaxID=709883 RepID=UPI002ED10C0C|nr:ABC transporter permease [Micromonospora zamorensis]
MWRDGVRTSFADLFDQALLAVRGRRSRSLLTAAGIGLGIAATVATLGISASAAGAITGRFDAAQATAVSARINDPQTRPAPHALDVLRRLDGVTDAGLTCAGIDDGQLTNMPSTVSPDGGNRVAVHAAEAAALRALQVTPIRGRSFDDGHDLRGDRVALLDIAAAEALNLTPGRADSVVYLNDVPYALAGIYQAPAGAAHLTNAIVLPYRACRDSWVSFGEATVVARTELGAADQVGAALPVALMPEDPDAVTVQVPADLRSFRLGVEGETRALFLGLAAISLVIGALGVSNTTLVSVLERRSEIGLRRAVGASRRAIAGQFLIESSCFGLVGGIGGAVIGIDAISIVCLAKGWLVVIDPLLLFAGPAGGLLVGMLAGVYPARAAAQVAPATILRG